MVVLVDIVSTRTATLTTQHSIETMTSLPVLRMPFAALFFLLALVFLSFSPTTVAVLASASSKAKKSNVTAITQTRRRTNTNATAHGNAKAREDASHKPEQTVKQAIDIHKRKAADAKKKLTRKMLTAAWICYGLQSIGNYIQFKEETPWGTFSVWMVAGIACMAYLILPMAAVAPRDASQLDRVCLFCSAVVYFKVWVMIPTGGNQVFLDVNRYHAHITGIRHNSKQFSYFEIACKKWTWFDLPRRKNDGRIYR